MKFNTRSGVGWRADWRLWLLAAYLLVIQFTGGGSRADIESLIILRPLSVIMTFVGCYTLTREHFDQHRVIFGFAAAVFALTAAYLVPLPHAIWSGLPGREMAVTVDQATGMGNIWRPLSLVPDEGWNAFYSLFVPLSVLIFAVQLDQRQRVRLLLVVLLLAGLSALWGFLQAIGSPRGPLYLYRITNFGSAVGLFSNRNHQAMLLAAMYPMLGAYVFQAARDAAQYRFRVIVAVTAGLALLPLLMLTGSRTGLVLALVGVASIAWMRVVPESHVARGRSKWRPALFIVPVIAVALIAASVMLSRAESATRLFDTRLDEEFRLAIWAPTWTLVQTYFPFGSGPGTFVEVFQAFENERTIGLNYVNHAHNDWLEMLVTNGLPGLLLAIAAVLAFARLTANIARESRASTVMARAMVVVVVLLALGSLTDYPLRTPFLAAVFTVAIVLASGRSRPRAPVN